MRKSKNSSFDGNTVDQVWAAAAYGHRMNKGVYVKIDRAEYSATDLDGNEVFVPESISSRTYAWQAVEDTSLLSDEDMENGRKYRSYFQGLIFKAMQQKLNDFERNVMKLVEVTDFNAAPNSGYLFAILCSLPASYERGIEREQIDTQLRDAESKHIGKLRERLDLSVEVVRKIYSRNWDTYYYTCTITEGEHKGNVVFFGNSMGDWNKGDALKIRGTVKAHRDEGQTQLNRVKIK